MPERSDSDTPAPGPAKFDGLASVGGTSIFKLGLMAFLVLSLWAQWLGPGLSAELRSDDGSGLRVIAMFLPLLFGALGLVRSHPALRLLIFPMSFLPGMALLTEREWAALAEPTALLFGGATFAMYVIVAAVGGESEESPDQRPSEVHASDSLASRYRFFVRSRGVAVMVVLAAIVWSLFADAQVARTLVATSGERAALHLTFMSVLMLFAWVVMAYMAAVLPSLNWEYDRRQPAMTRAQLQLIDAPSRLLRRVVGWIALAALVIALGLGVVL